MDFSTAPLLVQAFYVFLANLLPLLLIAIAVSVGLLGLAQTVPAVRAVTATYIRRQMADQ